MSEEMKKKVEELLETSWDREWKIAALEFLQKNPSLETKTDQIEAMTFARGDDIGYTKGRISNKTAFIALNYEERVNQLNTEYVTDVSEALHKEESKQKPLKLYISLLEKRQAEVLWMLFFKKIPTVQVAKHYQLSTRTITRIKNDAIAKLVEMYEYTEQFKG